MGTQRIFKNCVQFSDTCLPVLGIHMSLICRLGICTVDGHVSGYSRLVQDLGMYFTAS
jgi:hypothetical protein